jgi:DNA-binding PadR family transcriptional regulator
MPSRKAPTGRPRGRPTKDEFATTGPRIVHMVLKKVANPSDKAQWNKLMKLGQEIMELGGQCDITDASAKAPEPRSYFRHTLTRLNRNLVLHYIKQKADSSMFDLTSQLLPDQKDHKAAKTKVYVHIKALFDAGFITKRLADNGVGGLHVVYSATELGIAFPTSERSIKFTAPPKSKARPVAPPIEEWKDREEPDFDLDAIGKS